MKNKFQFNTTICVFRLTAYMLEESVLFHIPPVSHIFHFSLLAILFGALRTGYIYFAV